MTANTTDKGLPGLFKIRVLLKMTQASVAESLDYSEVHIRHVETLRKDCSQKLLRLLTELFCCKPADLLSVPTEARLAQIKADADERTAAASRATATALNKAGAA